MAAIFSVIRVRGVVFVDTVGRTVFKGSCDTAQYTHCVWVRKVSRSFCNTIPSSFPSALCSTYLYEKDERAVTGNLQSNIFFVYSRNINVPPSVFPRFLSSFLHQFALCREIIAVCSQVHTKHINTLCGQNVECRTYRAVNTHRLSYKNQPVNTVQWNNRCLFSDTHKTHKHCVGRT